MTNLVTTLQSDSSNDGTGASTIMQPPQLDNVIDDAIIIKVTQSLNSSSAVAAINVTTPTGYTLLVDVRDSELRSWVFYKRSVGSETVPSVISDTTAKRSCTTVVVTDVDWVNGGVNQQVNSTGNGDMQSLSLTTSSSGSASAIVCLYSVERRVLLGFRYPDTRPQTVYKGGVSTGTSEGVDNASGVGFDYIKDRSTTWTGPFWDVNGGGDSVAINVEVITQNNVIPLQSSSLIIQNVPTNTLQTNMNWCREIVNSGKGLDGSTLNNWNFDGSTDVNTSTDEITITGHGMDESMVIYLQDNGNTAPTGLSNDTFYFAFPQDANTIKLCSVNEDSDSATDFYYDGTTQRPIVNITATGSGNITFIEARMINAGQNPLDIFRPNSGDASNIGPFPGTYVGDAGYNQNNLGTAQQMATSLDVSSEIVTFQLQVNAQGRLERVLVTMIDEDGDWINWKVYQDGISARSTGQVRYQIQPGDADVQSLAFASSGTFDSTKLKYFIISTIGTNTTSSRFGAVNSLAGAIQFGGPFTVINGTNSSITELVELASTYTDTITKPSDLQVVSTIPISIGNGVSDISFSDSEKSIAFPPLADGINTFQNYIGSLGITINATSSSFVNLQNSQIGASVPFSLQVNASVGSNVDLTGNSYVFGTASLSSDIDYNRQLFVGGEGVKDNGSQIRNSTFIVNSQLGADHGMIDLDSSTDIESSTFELSSGTTTGHAIEIISAGTYTFSNLTFNNFGLDGTSNSAVYNNSGGAVTIIVDGGNNPTVRNGAGSSTTLSLPPRNISVTGLIAGSRLRIYNETTSTEVYNSVVAGTSYIDTYAEGVGYSTGDVLSLRVAKIDQLEATASVSVSSIGWSALISQTTNQIYADYGVDGSTVTGITRDSGNMEFDFNDPNNEIEGGDIGAWYYYFITTATGISETFGALSRSQVNRITNVTSLIPITFDNVKSVPLVIKNCWIDRDDGVSIISSTSNSIQIDPPAVFVTDISTDLGVIEDNQEIINNNVIKASKAIPASQTL